MGPYWHRPRRPILFSAASPSGVNPSLGWQHRPFAGRSVRGRTRDRALLEPLHGADADAVLLSGFADAEPVSQRGPDRGGPRGVDLRPAEAFPALSRPGDADAQILAAHRALGVGEDPRHLEHGPTLRLRRIDSLLFQIEVDAGTGQLH